MSLLTISKVVTVDLRKDTISSNDALSIESRLYS
ncbi:hypothetical protein NC653_019400 [Populus alba x Populus x berolinensis]|uniref:Uncharacterized protein n=1 Tax=Populus alba x Populus x berolinensis TaxID=444605 RepID=A0AAD6QIU4_9ROSI|nr:hypothetical protein NC653_019400 [Populus alba x Populus x berolinensis]